MTPLSFRLLGAVTQAPGEASQARRISRKQSSCLAGVAPCVSWETSCLLIMQRHWREGVRVREALSVRWGTRGAWRSTQEEGVLGNKGWLHWWGPYNFPQGGSWNSNSFPIFLSFLFFVLFCFLEI